MYSIFLFIFCTLTITLLVTVERSLNNKKQIVATDDRTPNAAHILRLTLPTKQSRVSRKLMLSLWLLCLALDSLIRVVNFSLMSTTIYGHSLFNFLSSIQLHVYHILCCKKLISSCLYQVCPIHL